MTDFSKQLISLISEGDNDDRAKSIIESSHLYTSVDAAQTTLLHYAAERGNDNITKYLLDRGCPVDPQDTEGKTPLMIAMSGNREKTIKVLLEAGADMNIVLDRKNKSALHYFFPAEHTFSFEARTLILKALQKTCSTSEETAKKMIDAGCHLYQAVCLNDATVIECMLKQGLSADSRHPTENYTALHLAVPFEDVKTVRLLLKNSADVNVMDHDGASPLYYLYRDLYERGEKQTRERAEILRILLSSGASATSCINNGIFQISFTLVKGTPEIIRVILQSNINFAATDKAHKRSILHYLAMNRNEGVVEELKHHISKFDVNVIDKEKVSPLLVAITFANVGMVKFLLEHGADPNCTPLAYDFTSLYYAYAKFDFHLDCQHLEYQHNQCAELLLQHNANPQFIATEKNGRKVTIFDVASKANSLHRIKPVIAHLAMIEALGTSVNETIHTNINSDQKLKEYFNRCRRALKRKIIGSITVLKLLNADKKKLAIYLNNEKLVLKLQRLRYKPKALTSYTYYYNTLRNNLPKGMLHNKFKSKASRIVSKIFQGPLHNRHLVVDKMIDYLNDEDLSQLYEC